MEDERVRTGPHSARLRVHRADRDVTQQGAELMYRTARAAAARASVMCDRAAACRLNARRMSREVRRRVEAARANAEKTMNLS